MNLFKTSFWNGLAVLVRLMTGFISIKVIAVIIGPAGLGVMGQFQNIVQIVQTFSGSLIQQGVVKYTAEYWDEPEKKILFWSEAFRIIVISSCAFGALIIACSAILAEYALHNIHFTYLFIILGLSIFFYVMNNFLLSMLNGERLIREYTFFNVASTIMGLIFNVALTIYGHLNGALIALVLNQCVSFILLYPSIKRKLKINFLLLWQHARSNEAARKLLAFGAMGITSAIILPVVQMAIRSFIVHKFGWASAGYWQSVTRLSDTYLMLITTTLNVYYLPKLAMLKERADILKELRYGYKTILPVAALFALAVFVLKKQIVLILFSKAFLPILGLLGFQLAGDVVKIASWLLGNIMWAKSMTKTFILSEILFGFTYIILSTLLMAQFGLKGVTLAFLVNYLIYFIFLNVIIKKAL